MLRCTVASLIPLMLVENYKECTEEFYKEHKKEFDDIIRHKSFYILRKLPVVIAESLLIPELPCLITTQMKNGMWKGDTERMTYDILSAIKHIGRLNVTDACNNIKYSPLETLKDNFSFYSLLIKKNIYEQVSDRDRHEIEAQILQIKNSQNADGSWEDTVVGTVTNMEMLLDLDLVKEDEAIQNGIRFLYRNLNEDLQGIHTKATYDLVGHHIFTTKDRDGEFDSALRLKPEWLPRNLCFRTLAIIPNAISLTLFIRLGMENDKRIALALENIYQLYKTYGGLCATNIKQPFLKK